MEKMNGSVFRGMIESGCNNLNNHKKDVDALNVFPVPDGDTGTNMSLTFSSGLSEVKTSGSQALPVVSKTFSRGLLMGARGNSGVILSQIFRGFNKAVADREELSTDDVSKAMLSGAKTAYKAVMRPVEGTILTVVREASQASDDYLQSNPETSLEQYFDVLCSQAKASLDHTPDLLPILKEARVVDSGGAGLLMILEGFAAYLKGEPIVEGSAVSQEQEEKSEVASGYRTEFILKLNEHGLSRFDEDKFRSRLEQMANKITLYKEDDIVKLRVNTMSPGEILSLAQRYGDFTAIQIEPVQSDLKPSIIDDDANRKPAEEKEYGMIAVCAGEGLSKLFRDYRTDIVISGGQTMNPSTEDFVSAIEKINARHIYVMPNNSNIIMAAKQAAQVIEGRDIIILETKSIPQGLSACISFNPEESVSENTKAMREAISHVKSGSITYAIKDTSIDGQNIKAGDYMALLEHDIVYTDKDKIRATEELLKRMCDEDTEIITVIKGEEADDDECGRIEEFIDENYDVDVDIEDGGQPVYSFLISVE